MGLVFTEPYAIPYTEYVDCRQLELWARESYKYKMLGSLGVAGRALLAMVALQDAMNMSQARSSLFHFSTTAADF
jgi:hypothetical protein